MIEIADKKQIKTETNEILGTVSVGDDIEYLYHGTQISDSSILVTAEELRKEGDNNATSTDKYDEYFLKAIMNKFSPTAEASTRKYSVVRTDRQSNNALTLDKINELSVGINSNLDKVLSANNYVLQSILVDAFLGRAYECIYSNINTEYKLEYPKSISEEDSRTYNQVKDEIDSFNEAVDIEGTIKECVVGTAREGNHSTYLRLEKSGNEVVSAVIDHYPLSYCYPSDYYINGENLLEFNIDKLKDALSKTYDKTRKKRKALYFEQIKEEIKENYPEEVYEGYENKETKTRLDPLRTGFMKINSMGRKFGVSLFFKALKPLVVLNNIETADVADSKTRSKKIIFQKLRKELLGNDGTRKGFAEMEYAHSAAAAALKTNFCLYTAPAFVEDLSYVVDDSNNDKTSDSINIYTSKLLTALGIGFVDSSLSSYSIANISVTQLMRTINSISRQLEGILHKYYCVYLDAIGLPPEYAPKIHIVNSEMMEWNLKKEFAQFIYSTLNVSRDTAFKVVGLDLEDEKKKRLLENEENLETVFYPHPTSYNSNATIGGGGGEKVSAGRPPSSQNTEKQEFDKNYSQEVRT